MRKLQIWYSPKPYCNGTYEECFVHYGYRDPRYTLKIAPKWYQALYEKFVKNQPTNNEE